MKKFDIWDAWDRVSLDDLDSEERRDDMPDHASLAEPSDREPLSFD